MYKRQLAELKHGSPEWVVAHAIWQKSRGRRPSEPFGQIRDPQKAYKAALHDLLHSTPLGGTHIDHQISWMVKVATLIRMEMSTDFNGTTITVRPDDIPHDVAQAYRNECERRHQVYIKSPEYKAAKQRAKQAQMIRDMTLKGALTAAPKKMTLSRPHDWDALVKKNTDPYGAAVMRYTEIWARLMEGKMSSGSSLEECADEASRIADNEGITGFMYGLAVSILSQVWVHGEQLRRWHNKDVQIGNEGDRANRDGGVLNPALLRIG